MQTTPLKHDDGMLAVKNLRWTMPLFLVFWGGCQKPSAVPPAAPSPPIRFAVVDSGQSGVDFFHHSGKSDQRLLPEMAGSGVALLDLNDDQRPDLLFLSQGSLLSAHSTDATNRAYLNLGDLRFREATEPSQLGSRNFSHGAIVADLDNDGFRDLYVTNYGVNSLFRNQGDGTFCESQGPDFAPHPTWSTGAAAIDGDGDGDLDLYVASYSDVDLSSPPCCQQTVEPYMYCMPHQVPPGRHAYYENMGDWAFEDRTAWAGMARRDGRGFQVTAAHLNEDDYPDLYVANDVGPNFVFLGRPDGAFADFTDESGAAYTAEGVRGGSMGVAVGDVNEDGAADVLVTNYQGQLNNLYVNAGGAHFLDQPRQLGLGGDAQFLVGWGAGLVDFDNDGRLDLFVSNGHVDDYVPQVGYVDVGQRGMIYRNTGNGFTEISRSAGPYFTEAVIGRGTAFGDLDGDGDRDVVLNSLDSPATLLRNDSGGRSATFRLVGRLANRDAVGARLRAVLSDGRTVHRQITSGEGYLGSNAADLSVGLGACQIESVTIVWPDGRESAVSPINPQQGTAVTVVRQ